MGIILRQGFKHSVITLIATIVGMINTLFIYTYFLTKTELGLFRTLVSYGQLISPFLLLGFGAVAIRYFSNFQSFSKKRNGFLFFLLLIPFLSYLVFIVISFFFQDYFFSFLDNHEDQALLIQYLPFVLLLVFSMMYGLLLHQYISNFKRIVIPEIFNNLWIKLAVPALAIIHYYDYLNLHSFILGICAAYFLSTLALFIYLWWLGELDLYPSTTFLKKPLLNTITNYAGYAVLGSMGTIIATRIDTIMVASMINLDNTAIYTVASFIAIVIGIPLKSVYLITSPIIAESLNKKDYANVKKLYSKTSLNLLILGILLLVGIWASVDLIFEIIPKGEEYKAGKYIVLVLGLAKIYDMVTGINTHIIIYSEHYRYNLYFGVILAVLNVVLNLLFIPIFDLIGVAIATLTSMILFNTVKVLFVWQKFKMHPFTGLMFYVLGLGLIAYLAAYFLPSTGYALLDIILRSLLIFLIYVPGILFFNLSEDFTLLKQRIIEKLRSIFN